GDTGGRSAAAADVDERQESDQFSKRGAMAGAAVVKDAMYNGSLLNRLLEG
ncbi:hypothetical protein, partial [Cronobacter sakazakii]|uniref:hypothetical protein n=1 Tax=Cronobacter sakazakii TaxID=28141 RepID=UPI001EFCC180